MRQGGGAEGEVRVQWEGEEAPFTVDLDETNTNKNKNTNTRGLLERAREAFGLLRSVTEGGQEEEEFCLTDGEVEVKTDGRLASIVREARESGGTPAILFLFSRVSLSRGGRGEGEGGASSCLGRERISFVPHPRTITAAGDLEYFTSTRGKQTVSYALAELVDNALSATQHVTRAGEREVRICFCVNSTSSASVFVEDNGVGMNKSQVNDWAVMNLSKSERERRESGGSGEVGNSSGSGSDPFAWNATQHQTQKQKQAGGWKQDRHLFSSLSFFGVGSKNAAFFLGNSVHMATKQEDNMLVHDLRLSAKELETKYRNKENAYEADLIHRVPGDLSTLTAEEKKFGPVVQSVLGEGKGDGARAGENKKSFTRLTVSELKRDVIDQIKDRYSCEQICRELAHIYHFYIHGANGKSDSSLDAEAHDDRRKLPDGSALPAVEVEFHCEGRLLFKTNLCEVEDEPVSLHLKSKKEEFPFSLEVPQRGRVDGILYYFPFDSEKETLPSLDWKESPSPQGTQATQFDLTQVSMTQFNQHSSQFSLADPDAGAMLAAVQAQRRCLFETFWQGRLIPESRVVSLPFIDSIFQKQGTYMRDKIPPEVINRIWGCLFFGPEFRVTRNKLSFRDNLEDLLCSSFSSNRNTEKKFKEWLARCHSELDQTLSFEKLCPTEVQATMRSKFGENKTFFDRVVMGDLTLSTGDVVQLKTTPKVVGRIANILSNKIMHADGRHSNGYLAVQPIPEGIYGSSIGLYPLRRYKSKLSAKELESHVKKQWSKCPSNLSVEPLHLATGKIKEYAAGDTFPPTYISVTDGSGQRITKCMSRGKKQNLSVIQKLYYLGTDLPQDNQDLSLAVKETVNQSSLENPVEVLCVSNCTPRNDIFGFQKVNGGLKKSGYYLMKFMVEPDCGKSPLVLEMKCRVKPSEGERAELECGGKIEAVQLGEALPPISLSIYDEFDNLADTKPYLDKVKLSVVTNNEEIAINAESKIESRDGKILLKDLKLSPSGNQSIPYFCTRGRGRKQGKPNPLKCKLSISVGEKIEEVVKVTVSPGLPVAFDVISGIDMDVNGENNPLQLAQDSPFPSFVIALKDQYGNRTSPPKDYACTLKVSCEGLVPDTKSFTVEDSGMLSVEGFVAEASLFTKAVLQLRYSPTDSIIETCTVNNDSIAERHIWMQIEPSAKPAQLAILRQGQEVPKDTNGSDDFVIEDIQVATFLEDLSVEVRDGSGRPAPCGTSAKLTCSWVKGTKQVQMNSDSQVTLPALAVQENCGSVVSFWVRVVVDGFHLEASMFVRATPGPPYSWAISCESNKVYSGVPFVVIIEAVDKHQNRCRSSSSQLPTPEIEPQSERELCFKKEAWESDWTCDEDNMYTYSAKIVLSGEKGPIALRVHSENDLNMTEDIWHVPLLPGPPSKLSMSIPNESQKFYTQCCIEKIFVEVQDDYGNAAPCKDFEILLQPSLRACDTEGVFGNASSKSGNRKKVKDGKAEFASIKLSCPEVGKYILQAVSKSRKLSIEEATMEIEVQSCNRVVGLEAKLPEKKCQAGGSIDIDVVVETENKKALARDALSSFEIIISKDRNVKGSISAKFVDYDEKSMTLQFSSDKVTAAGVYNLTAVYNEGRSELGTYQVRSLSQTFEVTPFEPKQLCLMPPEIESQCTILHVSDKTIGREPILPSASMQLQDIYGNFVAKSKVKLSFHLYADEAMQNEIKGSLTCDGSPITDKSGQAAVRNIVISDECKAYLTKDKNRPTLDVHFAVRCHEKKSKFLGWKRVLCYSNDEKQTEKREKYTKEKKKLEKALGAEREKLRNLEDAIVAQKEKLGLGTKSLRNLDQVLKDQESKVEEAEKRGARGPQLRSLAKFNTTLATVKKISSKHCVGWMVEQATVEHECLTKILSWFRRGKLQVLIMTNVEIMQKARKALKQKGLDIPDMIAEEAMRPYDGRQRRRASGCKMTSAEAAFLGQMGCLAKKLHEDALLGSDGALEMPLPHHHVDKQKWPKGLETWPAGFVGHAANLLRPKRENRRSTTLYTMTGSSLVFDEWPNAYKYFRACSKDLRVQVPSIFNLDGTMVESDGVLTGSRNNCPKNLSQLKISFGSSQESLVRQKEKLREVQSLVEAKETMDKARESVGDLKERLQKLERKLEEVKGSKKRPLLQEIDANQGQDEEVPSSQKRASQEEPQESRARSTRRRRMIMEMED